jgi:FKBP-type peptidyl-prolyl cis-trans isomerase
VTTERIEVLNKQVSILIGCAFIATALIACSSEDKTAETSDNSTPSAATSSPGAPSTAESATPSGAAPATSKSTAPATSSAKPAQEKASASTSKLPGWKLTAALKKEADGLQYADLTVGKGKEAKAGDSVTVHYTGYLTDGTKFDSSVDRGTPFQFDLGAGKVIKGWDEGVAGMKVGGKRKLVIPSDLGYGPAGTPGGPIPPNATLVFDVQLLKVGA